MTRHELMLAVLDEVKMELCRAWAKFPRPQASMHEGYAVMKEEVDEMWDAIKSNQYDESQAEAIQVAAMAVRFVIESAR